MTNPVCVVATFKTKPGKEKEAEAILKSVLEPTHREQGCITYALHKREDQPGVYYFIEKWQNQADLEKHLSAPHIRAAMAHKDELFTLVDIGFVSPMFGGDAIKGKLFS